jgi:hypothetical protein
MNGNSSYDVEEEKKVYEEDEEKVQHKLTLFFCIKSTKLKLILHTINIMKFLKRMSRQRTYTYTTKKKDEE